VIERNSTTGIHESIVTNLHESRGQHVLQEASDKLHGIESQGSQAVTVRFAVADKNHPILDLEDTRIGDSHSEDVGGKVLQACLAGAYGLGIDIPVGPPDIWRDLIEEAGFFHRIAKLGFEDLGEGLDGKIKINPGGVPEAIGGGEGAAWDDVMEVGVKLQGTPPGMEDTEESGEICADELLIKGQFLHCFRGSLEQGRVGGALVLTDEAGQLLWDSEGDHEMVAGELTFQVILQPLAALLVLTGGAMAISTGAIGPMELATGLTLIEGDTTSFGATSDDGLNDLSMEMRRGLTVALEVLRGEGSEDLIDGGHGRVPPSLD
jgi:hypothetical protein